MLNAEIFAFGTPNTKTYALSLAKYQIVLQHATEVKKLLPSSQFALFSLIPFSFLFFFLLSSIFSLSDYLYSLLPPSLLSSPSLTVVVGFFFFGCCCGSGGVEINDYWCLGLVYEVEINDWVLFLLHWWV